MSMPAEDPDAVEQTDDDQTDDGLFAQVEWLDSLMPEPRTRKQTVLPGMIEEAYNGSTNRRPKASRKDYALGFEAGFRRAMEGMRAEMKRLTDRLSDS